MQKREKILGAALSCVLIGWLGLPYLESTFLSPLRDLDIKIASLNETKDGLWKQQVDLASKDAKMKAWRALSLPPNPENAQRLYQEWLTNLSHLSGFQVEKISLERRVHDGDTSVTIPISIVAKARLRELADFLVRFESVDLLQRISRCDVTSPANEGDPVLSFTLVAEGLSLTSAPDRPRLFPKTELFEAIKKNATNLTVVSNKGFPDQLPFCVRLGSEFLYVTAIKENTWTVQRGVEKTFAEGHDSGSAVELFPLRTDNALTGVATAMWTTSLFTKPAPLVEYKPHLATTTAPTAIRGKTWTWKLDVAGWNPAFGNPKFEILNAPPGLELNERSGVLQWKIDSHVEVGTYPVAMLIWGTNGRDAGFSPSVTVKVRDPNLPPKLDEQSPLRFFIGRESTVQLKANDPDGAGKPLTYALEQGPTGMTIDAKSGELKWKPADDMTPQKLDVKVKVTDSDEMPEVASATIPLTLEEDSARFTYLTGSVTRSSGQEEAWIYDRATNKTTVLHAGEMFRVADFEMKLETIGPTYIIIKQGDRTFRWNFEQPLTQMSPYNGA